MKNRLKVTLRVTSVYWNPKTFHMLFLRFIKEWLDKEHKHKTGYPYFRFSPPKLVKASKSEKVNDYCLSYTADVVYSSHLLFIKSVRYYEEKNI